MKICAKKSVCSHMTEEVNKRLVCHVGLGWVLHQSFQSSISAKCGKMKYFGFQISLIVEF